jgi:hypothetical protein
VKNFWTAQDIENLAAQGKTELVISDNMVLTDLARHMADQLGITIINRSHSPVGSPTRLSPTPPAATPVSRPTSLPTPPVRLRGKPKGCQHPPLRGSQSQPVGAVSNSNPAASNANPVVDQLVGLVKRLGGKGASS